MQNITIIKEIGTGMFNTVYLVEKNGQKYALRRQKILASEIKANKYDSQISREFSFYRQINKFNSIDQLFFTKLYDTLIYKCQFIHKPKHVHNDSAWQKKYHELSESPYCVDMLVGLKDGMLWELIIDDVNDNNNNNLTVGQKYSIIIQILYALHLMHAHGYSHGDAHVGNIAYIKCEFDKLITIILDKTEYQIPTFGYIISLIDYGEISHKKFGLTTSQEIYTTYNLDIFSQIQLLLNFPLIFIKNKSIKYPQRDKLLHTIFTQYYDIFIKMKNFLISVYHCDRQIVQIFDNYEKKLINEEKVVAFLKERMLLHPFFNLFVLYKKRDFCQMINIDFVPNFIDDNHIELVLLNTFNQVPVMEFLIKYVKSL